MVFSSAVFVWAFLPIVFILNCFLKTKISNLFLLTASLVFYAWGEPVLVLLMVFSVCFNWLVGKGIQRYWSYRKIILTIGIITNLFILGYYKYANFLVETINMVIGKELLSNPGIRLPIGISFFTFQAISYIVDVYRGETETSNKLINTALYISFFPQLIAGPIIKYKDINKQIENRTVSLEGVSGGFRRFIYGLSKKVLISNVMGLAADNIFAADIMEISSPVAWVGAIMYTLQIYYDFSGYSDMAIGLGRMFGFHILENFEYPYISKSVQEFWRRWHISLGSWFREYVYIPLGGNRKGILRTYINLFVVFFLTGLWHGANFTFIVWGLYYGCFSILERLWLGKSLNSSKVLSRIYMFFITIFGWVLFRSNTISEAGKYITRMIVPYEGREFAASIWYYVDKKTIFITLIAVIGMGILQNVVPKKYIKRWKESWFDVIWCVILLLLCLAAIASDTYNPFIYFQF